jgi:hypothetical protein
VNLRHTLDETEQRAQRDKISHDCSNNYGSTFTDYADLVEHCHLSSTGPGLSIALEPDACPLRHQIKCHFATQLGESDCYIRGKTNGNHSATVHELHMLMHSIADCVVYCKCGQPYDSLPRLVAHQITCAFFLRKE